MLNNVPRIISMMRETISAQESWSQPLWQKPAASLGVSVSEMEGPHSPNLCGSVKERNKEKFAGHVRMMRRHLSIISCIP